MAGIDTISQVQDDVMQIKRFIQELLLAVVNGLGDADRLRAANKEYKHGKANNKAAAELLDYMNADAKNEVKVLTIPEMDLEYISGLLNGQKVPYVPLTSVDLQTGENVVTFLFKDKDFDNAKDVLSKYMRHLDNESHELDIDTFNNSLFGHDYTLVNGLSKTELEVFRANALKHNFEFVVVHDGTSKDGRTYSIASTDKEALNKCLLDTFADMDGKEGQAYLTEMEKMWQGQEKLMNKIKSSNQPMYIVDASNLGKLIEIGKDGYVRHDICVEHTLKKNGETIDTLIERNLYRHKGIDKSILSEMRQMDNPVIITEAEAKKLFGVDNQKALTNINNDLLTPEFKEKTIEEFRKGEVLPVKKPVHPREARENGTGTKALSNLPTPIIQELKNADIEGLCINNHDIAFPPEKEQEIHRRIMENEYFQGVKPTDVIEATMGYMGRNFGKLSDIEKGEEYVLYNYPGDDKKMEIGEKGVDIYKGGSHRFVSNKNQDEYQKAIVDFMADVKSPVLITKAAFESANCFEYVTDKIVDGRTNSATILMKNNETDKKKALYKAAGEIDNEEFKIETALPIETQRVIERLKSIDKKKVNTQKEQAQGDVFSEARRAQKEMLERGRE